MTDQPKPWLLARIIGDAMRRESAADAAGPDAEVLRKAHDTTVNVADYGPVSAYDYAVDRTRSADDQRSIEWDLGHLFGLSEHEVEVVSWHAQSNHYDEALERARHEGD